MKRFAVTLWLICAVASAGWSQGILRGVVTDSTAREPLIGCNVSVRGTGLGAVTDREGKYIIRGITAGLHTIRVSYIGYRTKEVSVNVVEGENTLNAQLVPDVLEGEEIIVTGQMRGQVAAINQQITSNTIVNVISEEKIKELPDANAAEAIGRLPGVSLIRSGGEASKVIVRGMSDKFTSFTLDGIRIPPTDPDARGLDLSTFSQATLAGVELYKALTPDKDADAIAGSVNLVTRKAPAERMIRVEGKSAYNRLKKTFKQYDFNAKYGERFFDGVLGVQVTGNIERRDRSSERFNLDIDGSLRQYTDWEYTDFTLAYTDEARKRGGAGVLLDVNTPDGGTIRFNNVYNRTDRDYIIYSRDYPIGGAAVFYSAWDREQEINTLNSSLRGENILFDFNVGWGASYAQSLSEFPYDYRMVFSEPSIVDSSGMRPPTGIDRKGPPENFIPLAYNNFRKAQLDTAYFRSEKNSDREKTLFLDVSRKYTLGEFLTGELKIGGKYRYRNRFKSTDEVMAPYYLNYFQTHTLDASGNIVPKDFSGTRFANLELVNRLVLFTNFLDPNPSQRSLYGKYLLNPLLNRDALRLWYELNKNGISSNGRQLEYNPNPEANADGYDIVERISAGYLMHTLNFGPLATFIAGVRVEAENNDYRANYVDVPLSGFPTTGVLLDTTSNFKETIWLPNFHLTVRPTDFMNVRLAAYRAIARPDFNTRLLKFVARITNPRNLLVVGNPALKNAKAWNYEASTSFFGNEIGLFTVSAFYREIKDMFHTVSGLPGVYSPGNPGSLLDTLGITWRPRFPAGSPISLTYSVNTPQKTKVWGVEIEHQANLSFLPGFLSNIVLSYNFSFVRSETFILSYRTDTTYIIIPPFPPLPQYRTVLTEAKQKLEGQPEFFGNVVLGYDLGNFSGRISVFFQGEYNRSYSAARRSDPVVNRFSRWDLSLKQRLTDNMSVFLNINNLTNIQEDVTTVNRVVGWSALRSSELYGWSGDLGVRVEL